MACAILFVTVMQLYGGCVDGEKEEHGARAETTSRAIGSGHGRGAGRATSGSPLLLPDFRLRFAHELITAVAQC